MAEDSSLLGFVSSLGGGDPLRVEENLGDGYVRLRVLEAERRQAKHDIRCVEDVLIELLRNARDAGARKVLVASAREGALRTLVVLDDGCGIPEEMQERVFDARVTSKLDSVHVDRWGVHGRGMALFSIRENAESAEVLASAPGRGTAVRVVCDTGSLPVHLAEAGVPRARGRRGVARQGSPQPRAHLLRVRARVRGRLQGLRGVAGAGREHGRRALRSGPRLGRHGCAAGAHAPRGARREPRCCGARGGRRKAGANDVRAQRPPHPLGGGRAPGERLRHASREQGRTKGACERPGGRRPDRARHTPPPP